MSGFSFFRAQTLFRNGSVSVRQVNSVDQATVERGYRWIGRGDFKRAISTFSFAIEKTPDSILAFVGRGDAQFESFRDTEAIADYTRGLELLRKNGISATRNGEAEEIGKRMLSYQNQGLVFPFGIEAYIHYRRALAYHSVGKKGLRESAESLRLADADYRRVIELSPSFSPAAEALIRLSADFEKRPNKAPEPTPTSVTPPAAQESRRP